MSVRGKVISFTMTILFLIGLVTVWNVFCNGRDHNSEIVYRLYKNQFALAGERVEVELGIMNNDSTLKEIDILFKHQGFERIKSIELTGLGLVRVQVFLPVESGNRPTLEEIEQSLSVLIQNQWCCFSGEEMSISPQVISCAFGPSTGCGSIVSKYLDDEAVIKRVVVTM